ncbi:MAG: class I SAM-dependent methyltransferase [Flavobacteriaceae bacterium]|nr:class I SAM-dependent methyltransferase [Flavobacteriaceae bacterium]
MNKSILHKDIQAFINTHLKSDSTKLILKGSPFAEVSIQEIVAQIEAKKKCENKLPTWFASKGIYYPNKLNIAQTSSEITANYKKDLIAGETLIDVTGGLGVDSSAFASKFNEVIHCEIDTELAEIAKHNFNVLKKSSIKQHAVNGLDYLKKTKKHCDWIYIDPSRRSDTKEKVFLLNQCQPDLTVHLDILWPYSNNILIKLSPLLDIKKTIDDLKFVKEVHCVAVENELKELLFLLEKDCTKTAKIKTININKNDIQKYDFQLDNKYNINYNFTLKYIYEPNVAILKSGGFKHISAHYNLFKLHPNTHIFTSNILVDFPGRRFKLTEKIPYNKKLLKRRLPTNKANITVRNFPETVVQIRKKTGLKEGGTQYLFFITNKEEKHVVLICEKV